jgi:hypothetical protein
LWLDTRKRLKHEKREVCEHIKRTASREWNLTSALDKNEQKHVFLILFSYVKIVNQLFLEFDSSFIHGFHLTEHIN